MSASGDLEAQLPAADRHRRRLLTSLLLTEEEARRRIAADVHDDTLQLMAAAAMQASEVRRSAADSVVAEKLLGLERTMQTAMGRLRSLLIDLRPPALGRDGLRATLHRYLAARLGEAGIAYELTDDLDGEPPLETSLVAFRIAQEVITSVAKQAGASSVTVALHRCAQGLSIRITDDGEGFATDDGRIRLRQAGLRAMEERAELFGGRLRLRSAPGAGTTVEVWIPDAENLTAGSSAPSAGC